MTNVQVVDNIPVLSNLNAPEYSHFKGLQIVAGEQKVQLLIGQDNAEALLPLEVRKGNKGEPFAYWLDHKWS